MDRTCWVWLASRPYIRPQCIRDLLERMGSPEEIYAADESALRECVLLSVRERNELLDHDLRQTEAILAYCEKKNIQILTMAEAGYPMRLREIYNPPLVLYVRGTLPDLDQRIGIGMVGTRRCNYSGKQIAHRIARELTRGGAIVISGMAEGIDAVANTGALDAGGTTVAVLGCGVDVCYPRQHRRLMQAIIEHGAVVSEFTPGTEPLRTNFPIRNRIISGLSHGVVIVQAPEKSGSLITARHAMEQNRDVFAVAGDLTSPLYVGSHALIRDGVKAIQCGMDVLEEYIEIYPDELSLVPRSAPEKKPEPEPCAVSDRESRILAAMGGEINHIDAVIAASELSAPEVLAGLTVLEIQGLVKQLPGKRFTRV